MKNIPLQLFKRDRAPISTTPEINSLISAGSPVAFGVSGGKDSTAQVLATLEHLNAVGHAGPRVLIHSDLGEIEWPESLEWCRKLADRTGLELIVTRRPQGGMLERWEQRWADNVQRYADLSCVQLILPWSTPGMRFCTSELKVAPICRELIRRFPGQTIISATGIRRSESDGRANAPIAKAQPKLTSVKQRTSGIDWHPIAEQTLDEVWDCHKRYDFPPHPGYAIYGMSRISCMECIMQSDADARAVALYPGNREPLRRVGLLEIKSTYAFQGDRWRADYALQLFTDEDRATPQGRR